MCFLTFCYKNLSTTRNLCDKLIGITHALWNKRNSIEHDKTQHGLHEIEDVRLEEAVKYQYTLGPESLNPADKYLFNQPRYKLWAQKGEYIQAWLSTVLIARGEFDEAKKEMLNDRGNRKHQRKRATGREINLQIKRRRDIEIRDEI